MCRPCKLSSRTPVRNIKIIINSSKNSRNVFVFDFNKILNIAASGHVETIQNIIKDISPSQEHPASSKYTEMSAIFESVLDALNSTDINQIINIGHEQTIHYVIQDTSSNQEDHNHHQLLQEL